MLVIAGSLSKFFFFRVCSFNTRFVQMLRDVLVVLLELFHAEENKKKWPPPKVFFITSVRLYLYIDSLDRGLFGCVSFSGSFSACP